MSNPKRYDMEWVQGDTFAEVWTFKDSAGDVIDLSAGTADLTINENEDGSGTEYLAVSEADYIALGADGTVTYSIPPAVTILLTFSKGFYQFNFVLATIDETPFYGDIKLRKRIPQP